MLPGRKSLLSALQKRGGGAYILGYKYAEVILKLEKYYIL